VTGHSGELRGRRDRPRLPRRGANGGGGYAAATADCGAHETRSAKGDGGAGVAPWQAITMLHIRRHEVRVNISTHHIPPDTFDFIIRVNATLSFNTHECPYMSVSKELNNRTCRAKHPGLAAP